MATENIEGTVLTILRLWSIDRHTMVSVGDIYQSTHVIVKSYSGERTIAMAQTQEGSTFPARYKINKNQGSEVLDAVGSSGHWEPGHITTAKRGRTQLGSLSCTL